jgi:hypothetical protein
VHSLPVVSARHENPDSGIQSTTDNDLTHSRHGIRRILPLRSCIAADRPFRFVGPLKTHVILNECDHL